ncbi:DUF1643 domain-containing protein [Hymenobacter rigui]|uniref:DUF1643 domain-containing protein n=1 Tax=Hymenobacter rigui TaxID=334424 RepID=A0A428KVY0_9BACT|nr:DUF1643 domain-containing protein [Hymenobacter rigui]RSK50991.1 DUF1643 domain-containing protein [Hymenobacter rigui]
MKKDAYVSECERYRYTLARCWNEAGPVVCFVMLNPSKADAWQDDPTIRRCIGFAKAWGFGALNVVNLYSYRATKPADLKATPEPNGPESNQHLATVAAGASLIIAAWGNHGEGERVAEVLTLLQGTGREIHCLGQTKTGAPRHPLYVRADVLPVSYAC